MRNIFDQYKHPENRLTHAVFTVLDRDQSLLVPFLKWLRLPDIPSAHSLHITQQQVPGTRQADTDDIDAQGLPDACVFSNDNWIVLFECKVQATLNVGQIQRHLKTADRHGFTTPHVVVITVDPTNVELPRDTVQVTWPDVYRWFARKATKSSWAHELVAYMHVFERKMLAEDYKYTRYAYSV